MKEKELTPEEVAEMEKCKASPYYFATKYLFVIRNGKPVPFTTNLSEKDFNSVFNGKMNR